MRYQWDTVLAAVFLGFVLMCSFWLFEAERLRFEVPPWHFFLLSLATFRLVRLFSYDSITAFIRDSVKDDRESSRNGRLRALMNCPWCVGMWAALFVFALYYMVPLSWFALLVLALAGAASFIQVLANLVGWHAEGEKHAVKAIAGGEHRS